MADRKRPKMVSFEIEPHLLADLDLRARQESRSRSWMIRALIRRGLRVTPAIEHPVREITAEPVEDAP